jgi:hypothetical protein
LDPAALDPAALDFAALNSAALNPVTLVRRAADFACDKSFPCRNPADLR